MGGEGVFALAIPYAAGYLSDRLPEHLVRRFGRRSFFLVVSAPFMAASLAFLPFLSGYWMMTGCAFVFFAALHAYFTPLWTLMVDAVPDEERGRVQGVRGTFRAGGLAYGLVAAGLLYSLWKPLPFLFAAALIVGSTAVTWEAARRIGEDRGNGGSQMSGGIRKMWRELRENTAASWLLSANAFWNGAIDGIRPYFFLFASAVVGVGVATTSVGLIALVLGIGIGSFVVGRLGDRFDRIRLLTWGTALAVIALTGGFFVRAIGPAIGLLLVAGVGAASIVSLPYPVFAGLMDEDTAGQATGIWVLSVGVGRILSPMLVGVAVDLGARALPDLKGYPFMWLMAGFLALLGWMSLLLARRAMNGGASDHR